MERIRVGREPGTPGLKPTDSDVLETAMEAGHILLENGAEIFRVEETMDRICHAYGVATCHFFVLSNGIFTTGDETQPTEGFAKVQHIPVRGTRLDRVVAVNQLSREIERGRWTLAEARARLEDIRQLPGIPAWAQVLASGVGSACFCQLFGGTLRDSAVAFVAGFLLYVFMLAVGARMSRIIGNICGGALVTVICLLCRSAGLGDTLHGMVIGSIIPLIPGVSFTSGIRDLADGDYISGWVRLMDASLVLISLAIGMGAVFMVYHRVWGGSLL